MKKTLALLLSALLVFALVPVAALSVFADDEPAKITVPDRPTLTSDKVFYMSFGGDNAKDGLTKSTPKKTWGAVTENGIASLLTEGGTVVAVGKAYVGTTYTLPDNGGNTILFTAKDVDDTNYLDAATEFGTIVGYKGKAAHVFTLTGNVIFKDIGLLNRSSAATEDTFTFEVAEGAKVVVGTGVVFLNVEGGYAVPKLVVDEGGIAYLDVVGFSSYTGKGTIIVNNDLAQQINVAEVFAGFGGIVANEAGTVLLGSTGGDPAPGGDPTPAPATGSATVVIAAVALLASFGAVVALKKREER